MPSKVLICFLFVHLFFVGIGSANDSIDSLKLKLNENLSKADKASTLQSLAKQIGRQSPLSSIEYLQELRFLAEEMSNQELIAYSLKEIGVVWYRENDLKKSSQYYFKALEALPDTGLYEMKCRLHNNIGWNYQKLEDYEKAYPYFDKSEEYGRKLGNMNLVSVVLNNKGISLRYLDRLDEALSVLSEALELNQLSKNKRREVQNINNIGLIHNRMENYGLAIQSFSKALEYNYDQRDTAEICNNLQNLGIAFLATNKTKRGLDSLNRVLLLTENNHFIWQRENALQLLYQNAQEQEDYKQALGYYIEFKDLSDSLYQQGQKEAMLTLEAQYQLSEKEKTIQESEVMLLEQRFYNTVIVVALAIALLIIGFLVRIYFLKQKNENKLITLNKQIEEKNIKIEGINENLEKLVTERTNVIQAQNRRLKEYAFMNSHNIRGPLSRIMGLIGLMQEDNHQITQREMAEMLKNSAKEMDEVIIDVNKQLEDEGIN